MSTSRVIHVKPKEDETITDESTTDYISSHDNAAKIDIATEKCLSSTKLALLTFYSIPIIS